MQSVRCLQNFFRFLILLDKEFINKSSNLVSFFSFFLFRFSFLFFKFLFRFVRGMKTTSQKSTFLLYCHHRSMGWGSIFKVIDQTWYERCSISSVYFSRVVRETHGRPLARMTHPATGYCFSYTVRQIPKLSTALTARKSNQEDHNCYKTFTDELFDDRAILGGVTFLMKELIVTSSNLNHNNSYSQEIMHLLFIIYILNLAMGSESHDVKSDAGEPTFVKSAADKPENTEKVAFS